jgi:hypothetical protein
MNASNAARRAKVADKKAWDREARAEMRRATCTECGQSMGTTLGNFKITRGEDGQIVHQHVQCPRGGL